MGRRRSWWLWLAMLALATGVLRGARNGGAEQSHVALVYLLVVLGGSVGGGRALGLGLSVASVVMFDYFFQTPYDVLGVGKLPDGVALLAFFTTALVATHLLTEAIRQADEAQRRTREAAALAAERVRLAEEAEANRMKDVILASLSHDLRTPLTAIKALAQDAALHGDDNARIIEEQADRLSAWVGDLLDLSRIKAGVFPVHPEPNIAEDLVGAATRQVAGLVGGRRLATHLDLDQPVLVGHFDFVQSLRILTNLIDNALGYSPPDAPVELSVQRRDDMLVFAVADRGPGVPPEDGERVFEPYYRAAAAPTDGRRAGLGLWIARHLAEVQGGRLRYESRPGGGSVFLLELPSASL